MAVNNTNSPTDFRLFVRDAGAREEEPFLFRIQTTQEGHTIEKEVAGKVTEGCLSFSLPPYASAILANK